MDEYISIATKVRDLRLEEAPESKLGWYKRYIPKESLDEYNDYRASLKKRFIEVQGTNEDETKIAAQKVVMTVLENNPETNVSEIPK